MGRGSGPCARGGRKEEREGKEAACGRSWAGPGSGLRAPGKRRKERGKAVGRAAGGRKRRKGEEGRWPAGLGPKERRERERKKRKTKQKLLSLNMKFEFKERQPKYQCKEHEMHKHMVFPIFILYFKKIVYQKSCNPLTYHVIQFIFVLCKI
jgi:hypothetical protein